MPREVMEDELLRSIEEVEDQIKSIQRQVRTVLATAQSETTPEERAESSN